MDPTGLRGMSFFWFAAKELDLDFHSRDIYRYMYVYIYIYNM